MNYAISAGFHIAVGKQGHHHIPGIIATTRAIRETSLLGHALFTSLPRLYKTRYHVIAVLA